MIMFFERNASEVIMGIETRDAVEMVATRPVLDAETVIRSIDTGIDALVGPF